MGAFSIELLGPVRARVDGVDLPLGPPRQRAVFVMLAFHAGRAVSITELVDGIWGPAAPGSVLGSIHTYVSGLRKLLPVDVVRSTSGYRLPEVDVDVRAVEADVRRARSLGATPDAAALLRVCLSRFSGTPLEDVAGPFAERERQRLVELRLSIAEERAELLLSLGRHEEPIAELEPLVRAEPLRERLRGLLVFALHLAGRQTDALAEYDDIRSRLADQLGIDPGAELSELRRRIDTTVPATPAQLPEPATHFVGRHDELDRLVEWSGERSTLVISAIDGAAGIGKTALAVRFAHHVKERFPDGQLYVDLRGYDPKGAPMSVTEALVQLLRGLGATHMPPDEQAQAALYRSLVAHTRTLVVLDNAFSVDQVRPLLPGTAGGLVVVTSRSQLRGLVVRDGARRLTLDVLPPDEAVEVLARALGRQRVNAEPEAAAELARLCGHLPLALRLAAERTASFPDQTLRERVNELLAEQDRLDHLAVDEDELPSVRAVFSWSYRALSSDLARAFRLLGLHPGADFSLEAAAALLDLPPRRAGDLLTRLVGRHLVEPSAARRYRFHDLLRVYAAELATGAERGPAVHRLLNWYLHTTVVAHSTSSPGLPTIPMTPLPPTVAALTFDDPPDAFAWQQAEAANIFAMTELAAAAEHDELVWTQTCTMFDYYYSTGLLSEWLSMLHRALSSAERLGDPVAQARVLSHLSVAQSRIGDNDLAVASLRRGLDLVPGVNALRAGLLANLGSTLREAGRHAEGIAPALEALEVARATGNRYYEVGSLDTLCELYVELGQHAEALEVGRLGLEIVHEDGQNLMEANLLVNLAHAHRDLGHRTEAMAAYDATLRLCRSINDRYHEALALYGMARLDQERAAELAAQALELFEKLDAEEAVSVREFLTGMRASPH